MECATCFDEISSPLTKYRCRRRQADLVSNSHRDTCCRSRVGVITWAGRRRSNSGSSECARRLELWRGLPARARTRRVWRDERTPSRRDETPRRHIRKDRGSRIAGAADGSGRAQASPGIRLEPGGTVTRCPVKQRLPFHILQVSPRPASSAQRQNGSRSSEAFFKRFFSPVLAIGFGTVEEKSAGGQDRRATSSRVNDLFVAAARAEACAELLQSVLEPESGIDFIAALSRSGSAEPVMIFSGRRHHDHGAASPREARRSPPASDADGGPWPHPFVQLLSPPRPSTHARFPSDVRPCPLCWQFRAACSCPLTRIRDLPLPRRPAGVGG
jgi:hypothetical protein